MAKKKTSVLAFPRSAAESAPPAIPDLEPSVGDEPIVIVEKVYVFPPRSRCPKCATFNTRATSTQGATQYRKCIRPGCRTTYKESGTLFTAL